MLVLDFLRYKHSSSWYLVRSSKSCKLLKHQKQKLRINYDIGADEEVISLGIGFYTLEDINEMKEKYPEKAKNLPLFLLCPSPYGIHLNLSGENLILLSGKKFVN